MKIWDRHLNIGKRITIYGDNAMHWGATIWTKKFGFICFRLPFRSCGRWWPLYLYCSPNATPDMATFYIGQADYPEDKRLAKYRRKILGHNFNANPGSLEYKMAILIPPACDVLLGLYGDDIECRKRLEERGYNPDEIQVIVNHIIK